MRERAGSIGNGGMRAPLAAVGLTSVIAQIVLMRELVATFYGNELLFGLVLTAWLAWVAAGAWGLARLATLRRLGTRTFASGLALAGVLLLAQITLIRDVRALLGVTPGAFVEFGPMVGALVVVLAPLCLLAGFLFTLGARLTVDSGGDAGQAYVWESVGAVVGGALFSFFFIRWLDPYQTAFLVGAVNLTTAVYLIQVSARGTLRTRPPISRQAAAQLILLFVILTAGAFPFGRYLHHATLRWQWTDTAFAADSPYGRLIIQTRDGQRAFFENGLLAFETQGTFPEEVVHFPLLAHPDPHSVLLIGGGVAGDLREGLKHPIDHITYVELDPLLIEAARAYLPKQDAAVLDDQRVTLILADGRSYVKQISDANQRPNDPAVLFDIVILDLPEPSTGTLNRFYTREFFTEVSDILNPGGIFALGLPSAENYWSPELTRRNGSVYHTLKSVFLEVLVLPGEHNFFLASEELPEADPTTLAARFGARNVETRWVTPAYIEYVFTTDRFAGVRRELEATAGVKLNTDLTPICYYYDLALWLSRFYPNLRSILSKGGSTGQGASLVSLGWIAVPLVLLAVLVRWRRGWAVPVAIAGIGMAQMALEVVILFGFQVLHGYVYAEISFIVTAFMAGLALGGAVSNRLVARWVPPARRRAQRVLMGVQMGIVAYSAAFAVMLELSILPPRLVFTLLALLAGILGGMAFPLAVVLIRTSDRTGRGVGMLYGADLVGGCLGALLGAVLFVPVLGIPQTCLVIGLVALVGVLMLV